LRWPAAPELGRGGLTMSLEGGLEELPEFFWTWASLTSKAAIRRSNAAQFAHGLSADTSIVPASYPIKPEPTKITLEKARERLLSRSWHPANLHDAHPC